MKAERKSPRWWPKPVSHFKNIDRKEDPLVVAEIRGSSIESERYHCYTGLIRDSDLIAFLEMHDEIPHEVSSSGPHPGIRSDYEPRFWIYAGDVVENGIEPLVVAWNSYNHTVLMPDQRFLMTYALTPRIVAMDPVIIHWDDPTRPKYDVVIAQTVAHSYFDKFSPAKISISRDYLQDYCSLRGMHLVKVYYAIKKALIDPDAKKLLRAKNIAVYSRPGRLIDVRYECGRKDIVFWQIWGTAHLIKPGPYPITERTAKVIKLKWPGINKTITETNVGGMMGDRIFVYDTVLQTYEGLDEYSIHPLSGSVSYGNQWSVQYCQRFGRDLVAVELRKLYEGAPADVIKHWHAFAAMPPKDSSYKASLLEMNVGRRSELLYSGLREFLLHLAKYLNLLIDCKINDISNINWVEAAHKGWWNNPVIESISRVITKDLKRDQFLQRCRYLDSFLIESFKEVPLRRFLVQLGMKEEELKKLKAGLLLDRIMATCQIVAETGLKLNANGSEIVSRYNAIKNNQICRSLLALRDLRIVATHRDIVTMKKKFESGLSAFRITMGSTTTGWGYALDKIYDVLYSELRSMTKLLNMAIESLEKAQEDANGKAKK